MSSPVLPTRAKRRAPFWLRALGLLFILAVLALLFFRIRLHFDVKAKLAAIRSAGLPTSGAELNQWLPSIHPTNNGALIITQAFSLFKSTRAIDFKSSVLPKMINTNTWSPEVRADLRNFLDTNSSALEKIDAALAFEQFRYPVDYTPGFATLVPHLSQVKTSAALLSIRTALAAEEQNTNEWSQLLEQQIKLGESLNHETLIGTLVRAACMKIAADTAERCLQFSTPAPAACRRLQSTLLRAAETNLLPGALISERAMAAPIFRMSLQQLQQFGDSGDEEIESPSDRHASKKANVFVAATGFFARDLNFYLDVMQTAINLAQQPTPASLVLTNHYESARLRAKSRLHLFAGVLLPALGRAVVRHAESQAQLRLAATAFAIEEFRQTRGRLPADLKELSPYFLPSAPIDPFTGNPLHYTLLQPGYRLYSVGQDGTDDGGHPVPKTRRRGQVAAGFDLTFTVAR
jgi:hypothetical protein